MADELLAFQVGGSAGSRDTVDRARLKGIPVVVFTFPAPAAACQSRMLRMQHQWRRPACARG